MGKLSDAILALDDLPREKVATPEWAPEVPEVWVRGLSASERDQYENDITERMPDGSRQTRALLPNLRAMFVARVLVDENGDRVFTSASDIKALGGRSARVLDRIIAKGRELSGLATAEEEVENPFEHDQDEPTSIE